MPKVSTAALEPTHMTTGYSLRKRLDGDGVAGFNHQRHQVGLIYTTGRSIVAWSSPLAIYATRDHNAVLSATEDHPGILLDLNGLSVEYHDGWWQPSAKGDRAVWKSGTVHSLTIRTATSAVAIRAPGSVPLDELIRVAKSIPILTRSSK